MPSRKTAAEKGASPPLPSSSTRHVDPDRLFSVGKSFFRGTISLGPKLLLLWGSVDQLVPLPVEVFLELYASEVLVYDLQPWFLLLGQLKRRELFLHFQCLFFDLVVLVSYPLQLFN